MLYQRGVGTQYSIFYIGWAHYFEVSGAFKQVESVFELGFQAKAHPYADLEAARNKFRLSVAQRVRFNEEQAAAAAAKKRPAAQLDQPRSSISNENPSISPAQASASKKIRGDDIATYHYGHPPQQQLVNGDLNGVISSSLNSVYGTEEVVYEQAQQTQQSPHYEPLGINLPPSFEQFARNHHEPWAGALCLEEPYEANKLFRYPKQLVYTGIATEFSPEEIRARKWAGKIATIKEANQRREQYKARLKMEQDRRLEEERMRIDLEHQQEQMRQEQLRQEHIRQEQLRAQEQERQRATAEYERQRLAEVERQRIIEAERQRSAAVEYQRQREQERKQQLLQQQHQQMEQERMRMEQETQRQILVQQQQQQQQIHHHNHHHHHNNHHQHYQHNGYNTNATSVVNNTINLTSDDIEEQIEASTIRFSTGNGLSKPKTITIKFRKEKPATASGESVPLTPQPPPPQSTVTPKSRKKSKVSKKNGGAYPGVQYHDNTYAAPAPAKANNIEEANLLLSIGQVHTSSNDGSAYSYSSGHPAQDSSSTYLQNDDSYSNSEFNASYPYSAENSNGNGPVANGGGSSSGYTSTPIRASTSNYLSRVYSKSSATPNFKILTKRISNISYQNDDSMCSFSAAGESSFYAAEADEELKRKRTEKALVTIQTHLAKPALDPFNMELCKAFLTKLGFPSREHDGTYKIMNTPIAKLSNAKSAFLANIPFQIEKEVGRGSYGSVFRYVSGWSVKRSLENYENLVKVAIKFIIGVFAEKL